MSDVYVNRLFDVYVNLMYDYLSGCGQPFLTRLIDILEDRSMAGLLFLLLCFAAVMALAMRHAPMWLWATAAVVATYLWQSGLVDGRTMGRNSGCCRCSAGSRRCWRC